MNSDRYYLIPAAAFVRGKLKEKGPMFEWPLAELDEEALESLFELGKKRNLKLHRFKRSNLLPRVARVLGQLQGWQPSELLDIGTGRGVFLWPFQDIFPWAPVHCIDILEHRVGDLLSVNQGGLETITASLADVTDLPFNTDQYDIVTFLETLEHIPDPVKALKEACRVARRAVILSVPSKADENPEHIHLFDEPALIQLFLSAGVSSIKFEYVLNHLVATGVLNNDKRGG